MITIYKELAFDLRMNYNFDASTIAYILKNFNAFEKNCDYIGDVFIERYEKRYTLSTRFGNSTVRAFWLFHAEGKFDVYVNGYGFNTHSNSPSILEYLNSF